MTITRSLCKKERKIKSLTLYFQELRQMGESPRVSCFGGFAKKQKATTYLETTKKMMHIRYQETFFCFSCSFFFSHPVSVLLFATSILSPLYYEYDSKVLSSCHPWYH